RIRVGGALVECLRRLLRRGAFRSDASVDLVCASRSEIALEQNSQRHTRKQGQSFGPIGHASPPDRVTYQYRATTGDLPIGAFPIGVLPIGILPIGACG